MGNCVIQNPPVFDLQIPKWDKTTRDNGEAMAVPVEKLFNNTVYNKAEIERLEGKTLRGVVLSASKWNNLTYTLADAAITANSSVTVVYGFDSIPAAQKANIRGKTEVGKLVLVAKKLPVADLTVDEIRIVNLREEG